MVENLLVTTVRIVVRESLKTVQVISFFMEGYKNYFNRKIECLMYKNSLFASFLIV